MGDDPSPEAGRGTTLPGVVGKAKAANSTTAQSASYSNRRAQFRAVYDANYHRVLGYVLRRTATRDDAEDVVAETFLTAWRRLEQMPPAFGARPWLYGIARNVLANHGRSERRRGRLTDRLYGESVPSSQETHADGDVAWVAAAFARLGDDDRELLALAAWEGLDAGEIAAVVGCSRNAARIRLHRARRRLARELQGNDVGAARPGPAGGAGGRSSLMPVETERGR
jgi:RNA polymerase sigma factor (sigma-70 family)